MPERSPPVRQAAATHSRAFAATRGAQPATARPPRHQAQDATSQHFSNLDAPFPAHDTSVNMHIFGSEGGSGTTDMHTNVWGQAAGGAGIQRDCWATQLRCSRAYGPS